MPIEISGLNSLAQFSFKSKKSNIYKTFITQEMLKHKILMPWISISYAHNKQTLKKTLIALGKVLKIYKKALGKGVEKYLKGHVIKPVFRKYN